MFYKALSHFIHLLGLFYQTLVPCSYPEQLPANTIQRQQYLGKWFFKAAVSHREAHIQEFKPLDNIWFNMEEQADGSLLLTGNMRMGDDCIKQTWTYHIRPDREDLELEGRPQRRTLLWSGSWANCPQCIILQEIEPPLKPTDSEDSLTRHMLYARHSDVSSEAVAAFLKNAACHNSTSSVTLPQSKEFCP